MFKTAAKHLKQNGVFIFDFWYGPGVLTDPPALRQKRLENNEMKTKDGNISHWLITGTFTAPQYTESFFPPALIR